MMKQITRLLCFVLAMLLLQGVSGCYTSKTAQKQVVKAQATHPEIVSGYCGLWYPSKDSVYTKTEYRPGETKTLYSTDTIIHNDTVFITKIKTQKSTDTVFIDKITKVENTAKIYAKDALINAKEQEITELKTAAAKQKGIDGIKNWTLVVLAALVIGFVGFKIWASKYKMI